VIAGGRTTTLTVIKLAGDDGTVLWRTDVPDLFEAVALAVDFSGDVVVGAMSFHEPYAVAIKLSGITGQEVWRTAVATNPENLRIDPTGDVFIGCVVKLSGRTGALLWSRPDILIGGYGKCAAVEPSGDVVAASSMSPSEDVLTIVALSDETGDTIWSQPIAGPPAVTGPNVKVIHDNAVGIDPAGGIIAVGFFGASTDDGREVRAATALAEAVETRSGGPDVDGQPMPEMSSEPLAQKFFGVRFSDRISGSSLRIRDSADPTRRTLRLRSLDPLILGPARGSPGIPPAKAPRSR
jgi:outer membrane protein assembly factor BamB